MTMTMTKTITITINITNIPHCFSKLLQAARARSTLENQGSKAHADDWWTGCDAVGEGAGVGSHFHGCSCILATYVSYVSLGFPHVFRVFSLCFPYEAL